MKKLLCTLCLVAMAVAVKAHEIDSLYAAFIASRGDNAVRLANEIMTVAGDTTTFTTASSTEVMKGYVLRKLIYWHYYRSEMTEVISYSDKAIELFRQQNDLFNMAGCYNLLGVTYQRMGEFDEAIDSYNLCNEVMLQLNQQEPSSFYQKNIRYTTNNMAAIFGSMGEFAMAEEMYAKCIEMLGELKEDSDDQDYRDMATYLQNLADIYLLEAGKLEGESGREKVSQAVSLSEQALDYSVRYNDMPAKVIQRMIVVSRAYFLVGRHEDAFRMLTDAMQMAEEGGHGFLQAEIENHYGQFAFEEGRYEESESHYNKAIAIAKEGGYDEYLLNAYQGACDASRMFDAGKALDYFEQSVALKDSIFNEDQQALIRDYQVKYDLAEKEFQLEIQKKNIRQQRQRIIFLAAMLALLVVILIILILLIRVRRKQHETLARLSDTKNRILAVASHEMKNSVLAQNMVLRMANEHFDNMGHDELKGRLAALKASSDELKDELYAILHWINGELGKETPASPKTFNLLQTVETCVRPHAEELRFKNLSVINDIAPQLECCDNFEAFNIVLQNLLSNAIKFSKEGGDIEVKATVEDEQVWVEVSDHGVGMSQERLQELMRDKVKSTQGTQGERGTGIGLFISRQLVEKNGGQLLVDSVEGQGTSFKFNVKKAQ